MNSIKFLYQQMMNLSKFIVPKKFFYICIFNFYKSAISLITLILPI